jgi:hypothetical protein
LEFEGAVGARFEVAGSAHAVVVADVLSERSIHGL